jgi:hypothetical protein
MGIKIAEAYINSAKFVKFLDGDTISVGISWITMDDSGDFKITQRIFDNSLELDIETGGVDRLFIKKVLEKIVDKSTMLHEKKLG